MNKFKFIIMTIVICLLAFAVCSTSIAQEPPCVENARTVAELNECGDAVVPAIDDEINRQFDQLLRLYANDKEMLYVIEQAKASWFAYRNLFVNFVGAHAGGGQVRGELPFDAEKAYLKAAIRISQEMTAALKEIMAKEARAAEAP